MTSRVVSQIGNVEHGLEIAEVAVQIARYQQLSTISQVHNATVPSWCGPDERNRLTDKSQYPFRRGHNRLH